MANTRAKQRDSKRVLDALHHINDCYHSQDWPKLKEWIDHGLGLVDIVDVGEGPKIDLVHWDKAFARLCAQFGVLAAFVIVENADDDYAGVRVGGAGDVAALVSDALENLETKLNTGRTASGLYVPGATGGVIKQ